MLLRVRYLVYAACAAAALPFLAAPAAAQDVTVYSGQAEYDAAAGTSDFCIDFDGSSGTTVSGDSFSAAVAFGSPEASDPSQVLWSSDAITDAGSTSANNGVGPMSGTFTADAQAFRLVFSSASEAPSVELYDASDSLIATVTAPSGSGFFGVVSATAVKRFVIRQGIVSGGGFFPDLRDRFFVDDFCATAVVEAAPEDPGLEGLCHALEAAIEAADDGAFHRERKKGALLKKVACVCRHIERGDLGGYCRAIDKLEHDVLPKTDGEGEPKDWVTDPTLQQDLEERIRGLIAALEAAAEELGGCEGGCDDDGDDDDDADDDDDDCDGDRRGDGKGKKDGKSRGRGHGRD